MNGTRRIIHITLGTFFLILGAIGIFVPLLPTTPFWLLTCWFYVRSSERLYNRVMSNRYFGPHIKGFVEDKAIPLRSKIITIAIMWLSTIITSLLLVGYWWVKALLGLISIGSHGISSLILLKRMNNLFIHRITGVIPLLSLSIVALLLYRSSFKASSKLIPRASATPLP